MKLISPSGVTVSVADEKGEVLKNQGYREVAVEKAATPGAPKRKSTRRKTETESNDD